MRSKKLLDMRARVYKWLIEVSANFSLAISKRYIALSFYLASLR